MQANTNKPAIPAFVIRLVGSPGFRPSDVPVGTLARIFNAIQRLVANVEKDEWEGVESKEQGEHLSQSIQLIGVRSGSAVYPFSAVDGTSALKILGNMGRNLASPSKAEWDAVSLSSIDDISAAARAIGVTVEIRKEKKNGAVLATITPMTYAEIKQGAFISGESSVFGCLERVGGTTEMRCAIRIPDQPERMIYCHVATEDVIRQLGQHLYENVRVSGTVTWLRMNWQVKTISITAFDQPKDGSILEALDRIYDAGGKTWEHIEDPDEFIAEIRRA